MSTPTSPTSNKRKQPQDDNSPNNKPTKNNDNTTEQEGKGKDTTTKENNSTPQKETNGSEHKDEVPPNVPRSATTIMGCRSVDNFNKLNKIEEGMHFL